MVINNLYTSTMLKLYKSFELHYMKRYENDKAIAVNEKELTLLLGFKDHLLRIIFYLWVE